MIDQVEALVVQTEAEALLVEQNFIKQYKPRLNIRLRDDKSYPYIAISLDEDFPRVYFTRERHRRDRAYFGPYSNAKRVRATLEVLGKVFLFRSCDGPEPGRRSGHRAWTTSSSAARRPASATSPRRSTASRSTRRRLPVRPLPGDRARLDSRCASEAEQPSRTPRASATGCGRYARCSSASGSPRGGGIARRDRRGRRRTGRPTRRSSRSATGCSPTARASTSTTPPGQACGGRRGVHPPVLRDAMPVPPLLVVQREVGARPRWRRR